MPNFNPRRWHRSARGASPPASFSSLTVQSPIAVPLAEPAVVEHKGIDAQLRRFVDEGKELFGGEIEVRRLPIIDDDGTGREDVPLRDDAGAEEIVEAAGKPSQPLRRECERRLRGDKPLAGLQLPAEIGIVDPARNADALGLPPLETEGKGAAVKELRAVAFPLVLARAAGDERPERIHLMGRRAAH